MTTQPTATLVAEILARTMRRLAYIKGLIVNRWQVAVTRRWMRRGCPPNKTPRFLRKAGMDLS